MTLRLLSVSFDRVEFEADLGDYQRVVRVDVASGYDWARAVRFPNWSNSDGESLGDDVLDADVRTRASEELVRLAAAAGIAREHAA